MEPYFILQINMGFKKKKKLNYELLIFTCLNASLPICYKGTELGVNLF